MEGLSGKRIVEGTVAGVLVALIVPAITAVLAPEQLARLWQGILQSSRPGQQSLAGISTGAFLVMVMGATAVAWSEWSYYRSYKARPGQPQYSQASGTPSLDLFGRTTPEREPVKEPWGSTVWAVLTWIGLAVSIYFVWLEGGGA